MSKSYNKAPLTFFAAANGFTGFRSYFEDVLSSYKLERIFILKGGPGTGKSTFMKRIAAEMEKESHATEYIFCSSDPSSLDGIIIADKIAILDGTAPHVLDTKYPGALDEIIDLGAFWDTDYLIKLRSKIEELNHAKKEFYDSAYVFLSFCSLPSKYINQIYDSALIHEKLDLLLNKNLRYTNKVAAEKTKVRLISSFSKNGLTHLQNTHCGELFKLPENDPRSYAILRYLKNKLSNRIKCIMPSPLDPDTPDAIVIEQDICISTLHTSDTEINIDNFFNKNINMFKLNDLFDSIKVFISDAASYFDLASKMHFQLEDIYHEAMNFDEMENLRLKTSSRIKNFLKQ